MIRGKGMFVKVFALVEGSVAILFVRHELRENLKFIFTKIRIY